MGNSKFPTSVPRKMYWSKRVIGSLLCPECGTLLEPADQTYMVAIRQEKEVFPYANRNSGGYFCIKCPVLVLDHNEFTEFLKLLNLRKSAQFVVLGIVDLDSMPEDKRTPPFDENSSIPHVNFINYANPESLPATELKEQPLIRTRNLSRNQKKRAKKKGKKKRR